MVDDPEWRDWVNVSRSSRKGVSLKLMTEPQRAVAMDLIRASLSARGAKTVGDIMKLNHALGELLDNPQEFGEDLYYFTVMGIPSTTEPWGWQLEGHHLVVNHFVLGDQVVTTPLFLGAEPTLAHSGKYQGLAVLQDEQNKGLEFINSLTPDQIKVAVLSSHKEGNSSLAEAFRDNIVLDYAGIKGADLTELQKAELLDLIDQHVGNMDEAHAQVKMAEVKHHLDQTHFAWVGSYDPAGVFYYRIQSPVVLIEFDHQSPGPLAMGRGGPGEPDGPGELGGPPPDEPPPGRPDGPPPHGPPPVREGPGGVGGHRGASRQHIHVVIRPPNGNDYGKDLLRQHYEQHPNPH